MNQTIRKALAPLGLIVASACFAGSAEAGCLSEELTQAVTMQKEAWHGDGAVRMMKVNWQHHDDDIVGFWNIVVSAKGNVGITDGTVLDRGLTQWHEDGTEFLNSSGQHPATQNYCLGTWEQSGPFTYKLNHFAYQYDTNQNVTGLVRIREDIKLSSDGMAMTGTSVVDAYDSVRNLLGTVKGVLVGKRITLDTTAQDIR